MDFVPNFNIDEDKFDIVVLDKFNIRFDIEGGDYLSASCNAYTGKYVAFDVCYCNNKKSIIPFEIINNNLNKIIDVYFEYFNAVSDEPLFKIHLTDFKFIGYLNLLGAFNDAKLDEYTIRDITFGGDDDEIMLSNYNYFNYISEDDKDTVKVFYTFSGFCFENCDINKTRMDKIDIITESSKIINHFIGKEHILVFGENFEIKKVE
jgi:hypothetical protein